MSNVEFMLAINNCKTDEARFDHMRIFADWLEEKGESSLSLGWRYIAEANRVPMKYAEKFYWVCERVNDSDSEVAQLHYLPANMFNGLMRGGNRGDVLLFPSRIEAEMWLAYVYEAGRVILESKNFVSKMIKMLEVKRDA